MDLVIEAETAQWHARVREIHCACFPTQAEANLVDKLRSEVTPLVSLIARGVGGAESGVLGHILFSPVILDSHPDDRLMGLAPMAVDPKYQRLGIGGQLVEAGLSKLRAQGFSAVAVLGHAEYYPRFGFRPSRQYSIGSEYDVPAEAFMLVELESGYLKGKSGTIAYHPIFKTL